MKTYIGIKQGVLALDPGVAGKVRVEIMTNDDNLESNLLTSSLLKICCLVQVELCIYCPVAGDVLTVSVYRDLTLQVNLFSGK